jgi:hypothetical protein
MCCKDYGLRTCVDTSFGIAGLYTQPCRHFVRQHLARVSHTSYLTHTAAATKQKNSGLSAALPPETH